MEETGAYRILSEHMDFVDLHYVIATLGPGILLIFKNRNPTSQRTHRFSVTKTS